MSYAIFRSDKMHGTDNVADLVNVKIPAQLENGCVLKVGALAPNEANVYAAAQTAATTAINEVVIIAAPEVMYDKRKRNLSEFINASGDIVRGYRFVNGDEFSLTADGFSGTPAVGNIVELGVNYKLLTAASATGSSTQVGKIIAKEGDYYVVKVVC